MLKSVSLGLLALIFSSFSYAVFAGNVDDCEALKDGASKGLYGLCIAWHNAGNDNSRDRILDNYNRKAGPDDPPMPGTDTAVCPCWDSAKMAEASANGTPLSCLTTAQTGSSVEFALYGGQIYQFFADGSGCFQLNPDGSGPIFPVVATPEELAACHQDIGILVEMDFAGITCDGT